MNSLIIPVLPLRDIVVFPQMVVPLFVGRKLSVNALNNVMKYNKKILLIAQNNSEIDNPTSENLYRVGTLAKILQLLKLPDGTIKVLVEGTERVKVSKIHQTKDFIIANYSFIKPFDKNVSKAKALMKIILEQFESYHKINKKIPIEYIDNIRAKTDSDKFADVLIANLNISLSQKQELLEIISAVKRLEKIYDYLIAEIDTIQFEKKIKGRVKRQMEKTQKEYYLNEQMKAIQKELGDNDDIDDITEIENNMFAWHHRAPNKIEYEKFILEIDES